MFALIKDGLVTCVNSSGFQNAIIGDNESILEFELVSVGNFWDGSTLHKSKPKSNDALKEQCKKDLASKRWGIATGGVVIDGVNVQSDDKSKDEMAGYVTESIVNGLVNVNWKLADGTFKVYTVQEFKKIYQFVAKYRNDCFGVESAKLDEINATGTTDLETGWPDNNFVIV